MKQNVITQLTANQIQGKGKFWDGKNSSNIEEIPRNLRNSEDLILYLREPANCAYPKLH